jgi:hypothetical protein
MRARSIKPSIFKNEILGTADPLFTLVFEGLWCLADRAGKLEDRPLRIHAEVNPYRDSASTVLALGWLVQNNFVLRYEVGGSKYLQIVNFSKHQQPHVREPQSKLPDPQNQEVVSAPCKHSAEHVPSTSSAALTPDSGLLTPDSGLLTACTSSPVQAPAKHVRAHDEPAAIDAGMTALKDAYPKTGRQNWLIAERKARQLIEAGEETWDGLRRHATRYADFCRATGRVAMSPQQWLTAQDQPYAQPWEIPTREPTKIAKPKLTWRPPDEDTAGAAP